MRIRGINNQIFTAKKFRIPVRIVKENSDPFLLNSRSAKREHLVKGNFVREYDNPKAEEYFYKALNADNVNEKLEYLDLMGEYKLIDIELEQKLDTFMKGMDNLP